MAELLFRGCNAAIPAIDVGEDVFAFHDEREEVARIQVKSAQGTRHAKQEGYRARFGIPMRQLERPDTPPLHYVLAVRIEDRWADFIIIRRFRLYGLWKGDRPFGREDRSSGDLRLYLRFRPGSVLCNGVDLQVFRNAWESLPPLRPLAALGSLSVDTSID